MKRSIAMLLVFVLLMAMFPTASAAAPDLLKLEITAAEVLPLTSAPDRFETMSGESVKEGSWIVPKFESYGMSAVIGDTMEIASHVCANSVTNSAITGVMIFKGTYDKITDSSKPVATLTDRVIGGHDSYKEVFEWDTAGCAAGDYTGLLFMMDANGEVIASSAVDLYLSKKSIPVTGLEIYVYELDSTPDEIRLPVGGAFSYGVIYEPYHATGERAYAVIEDAQLSYTGSGKADGTVINLVSETAGTYTLTLAFRGDMEAEEGEIPTDSMKIVVGDDTAMPAFTEDIMHICGDAWYEVGLTVPQNTECWIINGNTFVLETKVENNKLYVRALCLDNGELAVTCGNYIDRLEIQAHNHNYQTETQDPTCSEYGFERSRCVICGDVSGETVLPALGHDVAESVVATEPKATKDGIAVGHCSRCDQDVEQIIPRIFTDTEPDWFYSDALDYCYEEGIINGLTANTFGTTATLNRAQLVTMLYRHAGSPEVEEGSAFDDVPEGEFYTAPVAWASANGIVMGYEDGTFRPAATITREQIVTMLHRYVVMLGKDNGERNDLSAFDDLDMLHEYALDPMQWAVANGVINGLSETVLGPQESANRAQTVTILYRIITGILEAE